ncbi:hypothetical protein MAR_024915 [Mya arenaria]|uniref:Uncharacterized protein n=1 Tax=Mya arenaria TaxID=6604 RepID=A0ABY7DS61_MYAAR|nr:hypothetical protein MAR_024915 [Mya arenaria]
MEDREFKFKERGRSGCSAGDPISVNEISFKAFKPKLSKIEDGKDDMDAYMGRFVRSPLLTGKELDVYTRKSQEQADDHMTLKKACSNGAQALSAD